MKIFLKNIKKDPKIISLKTKVADLGKIKYLPSFSKEWKNIIYSYHKNKMKDIPVNDLNINKVIKSYFNLYFKDYKFVGTKKFILLKRRRNFMRNIHLSNVEIKHTNNKAIITVYTINREKKILRQKYLDLNNKVNEYLLKNYILLYKKSISNIYNLLDKQKDTYLYRNLLLKDLIRKEKFVHYKLNYLNKFLKLKDLYTKKIWSVLISKYSKGYLNLVRKYDLMHSLNEYKFNKFMLLPFLTNSLNKVLGKKIEYNIINLKSIAYNSDILTKTLILRLKKAKKNLLLQKNIDKSLNKAYLPIVNRIQEITFLKGEKNLDLYRNKYKDLKIISNLSDTNINKLLNQIHFNSSKINYNNKNQINNLIFNSIRYKNLSGVRLEVNGRLTKRYRADRSVHALKWKGGLKNIDSSFKRLSSVLFRGNSQSNITYSVGKSTRRVGAFAVKGWIGGK